MYKRSCVRPLSIRGDIMKVRIGSTNSEYNVLTKDFTYTEYDGSIRDPGSVDVLRPQIMINATIGSGNYAEIPLFGRYYFIDEITVLRADLTLVSMHVDPLTTYQGSIRATPCVCIRTQADAKQNGYLIDDKYLDFAYSKISFYAFQSGGAAMTFTYPRLGDYILITAG